MDNYQLDLLIQELQIFKNEVIKKLDEIKNGIIDIENELIKLHDPEDTDPDFRG